MSTTTTHERPPLVATPRLLERLESRRSPIRTETVYDARDGSSQTEEERCLSAASTAGVSSGSRMPGVASARRACILACFHDLADALAEWQQPPAEVRS